MTIETKISSSSSLGPSTCEKDAKAIEFIEEMTKNVESVQKKVLAEILSQNATTEYLQRFKLDGATDINSFKSKVPVVTYEDIKPDIQRVANGDKSPIFSSHPISEFLASSGTSAGERKFIPTTHEESFRRMKLLNLLMPVMNMYVPGLDKGKGLYFLFAKADTWTPGGLRAQPVLSSIYKNPHFHNRPYDPYRVFTSPSETIICANSFQSMYSQMLCGLYMREEVLRIGAIFASGLLLAIRFLQLNWRQLAYDIRTGTLSPKIVSDPSVRECMSKILKPNPELADFVQKECESEEWEGIIRRIWPHTKYLDVIITGTMAQYIPTLDYYSGGLPLASTNYASSECFFGLNLNPLCRPSEVSYTIMPNMGYFEFINNSDSTKPYPLKSSKTPHYLVDLANVEIGKEYELVVTTYAGLCRYRMGDILQVTGFHNAAPQFKFVKRMNVALSIDADKTTEEELQKGIENALALLQPYNVGVLEYTSYADIRTIPGHYVIYWELLVKEAANELSKEVLNECCLAIEESLNSLYRLKRAKDNSIGPLEIRVVKNGTFEELMDYSISRGASINQYKVPRCVNFPPIVELLDSRVVSTHFSPAVPRWIPEPTLTGSMTHDFLAVA